MTSPAGRAAAVLPGLVAALLVALMVSITAAEILATAVMVAAGLALRDPALRAGFVIPLGPPLAAFAGATLLSAALAPEPAAALVASKQLLLLPLLAATVIALRDAEAARRALGWLFAAVVVVAVHALAQQAACWAREPLAPGLAWLLKLRPDACVRPGTFRSRGFFSVYMTLGGSLAVSLPLLLALLDRPRRPSERWLLAPGLGGLVALGLSYVRGAWLGLAVAVALLAVLRRRLVLVLPVVVAAALVLAVPSELRGRLLSTFRADSDTALERYRFWEAGLRMLAERPLLGLGPGSVRRHYPEYRSPDAVRPRTGHLHNNLVQIAAERGLLGLGAWLWIWVAFFRRAGRIHRRLPREGTAAVLSAGSLAAVAGFLVAGLFEYNFGDTEVIALVWVVMALPFVCARAAPAAP